MSVRVLREDCAATVVLGFGVASQAATEDVAVIVNKSNPVDGLTMVQLRKFMHAFFNGETAVPCAYSVR